MLLTSAILLLLEHAFASPIDVEPLQKRQCPPIHVFGARETTAAAGYGSSGTVVDLILAAHSGATSEAINYPACGGQASCGDVSYASSVLQGVQAVTSAVNSFNSECPSTLLVLVGYSQVSSPLFIPPYARDKCHELMGLQGGQIMDDAFCGGGDTNEGLTSTAVPIQASAVNMIKAAIFMGDPRYIYGLPYDVGTCTAEGVSPTKAFRPSYHELHLMGDIVCSSPSRILLPISQQDQVLL